jgi:hypothetical protein
VRSPTALVWALILALAAQNLCAAPKAQLWEFWTASDSKSTLQVDHGAWQEFLDRYLDPGADGINRIRYARVTAEDRALLQGYLGVLGRTDPRELHRTEQLAYWINLYNALTVEVVLRHPEKDSILRMGKGLFSMGPWNEKLIELAGEPVTLNDVEHRILRPIWRDHRIHYVLNCASLGCPNLSGDVYTRSSLEDQLREAETAYINHERAVTFNDGGGLRLSSIYKWYRDDFAPDSKGLLSYLADHHQSLADRLRAHDRDVEFDYDWSLNRAD